MITLLVGQILPGLNYVDWGVQWARYLTSVKSNQLAPPTESFTLSLFVLFVNTDQLFSKSKQSSQSGRIPFSTNSPWILKFFQKKCTAKKKWKFSKSQIWSVKQTFLSQILQRNFRIRFLIDYIDLISEISITKLCHHQIKKFTSSFPIQSNQFTSSA